MKSGPLRIAGIVVDILVFAASLSACAPTESNVSSAQSRQTLHTELAADRFKGLIIGVQPDRRFHALHNALTEHASPWCYIAADRAGISNRICSRSSDRQPRIASEQMMYIMTNEAIGML